MKVIHLSHSDINGGAARAAYRIHQALLREDISSRMWVNKAISDDWTVKGPFGNLEKILVELRPRLINNTLLKMFNTNGLIHSVSLFPSSWVKRINNSNADLVNLHWIQDEMLSIADISKIKKPIVWTLHDEWGFCGTEHYTSNNRWREGYSSNNRPNYETGFDLNRWNWKRKIKYWKNPIQIVTPSKWLAQCVNGSKLMQNWPVSVIPNPINVDSWKPVDKKISREQLNLPSKKTLILFGAIGGIKSPYKGFDLLLLALKNLNDNPKAKDLELVVFGQSRPKLTPSCSFPIHFMGHMHDDISLRLLYSAADVMVVPSRSEAFGQTALEAQICGIPVVAFNIGGLPDIVDHKKTGYLAKAFNTEDLANGIMWVLKQRKINLLSNKIREQAVFKFSGKKIASSYLNIYKKVINQFNGNI